MSTAQDLEEITVEDMPSEHIVLQPISMSSDIPTVTVHEVSEPHEEIHCDEPAEPLLEIVLELGEIPGLGGKLDREHELEVSEEPSSKEEVSDVNDAKKSKKDERWDWESKGPSGFVAWVHERFTTVPEHSGYDSAGIERAISYLDKLDNEISKAMRLDLNGDLDSDKIEEIRSKIEDGIERLQSRLEKLKSKNKKKKKKLSEESYDLVKEAQKITGVAGIYVTVPLLISRIARVCINGMVSAGHDIEEIFASQVKKYKLNDREQAETMQLLSDMGYPLRQDRGFLVDEDVDTRSSNNFDWNANYKG